MEKYSKHLESIVAERTQDLLQEKQKTDRLLYSESRQQRGVMWKLLHVSDECYRAESHYQPGTAVLVENSDNTDIFQI